MSNLEVQFDDLLKQTGRVGIDNFIDWLHSTDFYTAPASTRYHGAVAGGLLLHSFTVFNNMMNRTEASAHYRYDSIAICSLLHDVCKANMYEAYKRNVKNEFGQWEQVDSFKINELYPFGGHGSKSVYLIMKHGIELLDEEAAAINCHMGGWDVTNYHNPGGAFQKYPLAVYLHIADVLTTYIDLV